MFECFKITYKLIIFLQALKSTSLSITSIEDSASWWNCLMNPSSKTANPSHVVSTWCASRRRAIGASSDSYSNLFPIWWAPKLVQTWLNFTECRFENFDHFFFTVVKIEECDDYGECENSSRKFLFRYPSFDRHAKCKQRRLLTFCPKLGEETCNHHCPRGRRRSFFLLL